MVATKRMAPRQRGNVARSAQLLSAFLHDQRSRSVGKRLGAGDGATEKKRFYLRSL
jgi:hypothetical protein